MQTTDPAPGAAQHRLRVLEPAIALPGMALVAITMALMVAAALGRGPLMAEIPVAKVDSIRILVQRSRAPVRTDPDTGWPCFR